MLLPLFLMIFVLSGFLPNEAHVVIKRQALIIDEDVPLTIENEISNLEETNKDSSLRTPQKYLIEPIPTVGRTNDEQHFVHDKVNFDDSNGEQQTDVEVKVTATENLSTTENANIAPDNVPIEGKIKALDDTHTQVVSHSVTNAKDEKTNNIEAEILSIEEVAIERETSTLQNSFPIATEKNGNNENVVKEFEKQAQLDTKDTHTTTTTKVDDSIISHNRPTNNDNELENNIVTQPIAVETFSTTTPGQIVGINPVTQIINENSKETVAASSTATQVTEATITTVENADKTDNLSTANEPVTTNIESITSEPVAAEDPTFTPTTTTETIKATNENISTLSQPNTTPHTAFPTLEPVSPIKPTVRPKKPIVTNNVASVERPKPRPRPTATTAHTGPISGGSVGKPIRRPAATITPSKPNRVSSVERPKPKPRPTATTIPIANPTTINNQVNTPTTSNRPIKPWYSFLLPSIQPLFFRQFNFTAPNRTQTHPPTLFGVGLFALPWNYTNKFTAWNLTLFPSLYGTENEARHGFLYANQTYYKHAKYNTTNLTAPILQIFFPLKYAQIQQQILNQQNANQIVVRRPLRRPIVQQQRFVNSDGTGITNKNDNINADDIDHENPVDVVENTEEVVEVEEVEEDTSNSNYLRSANPELPKSETKKTSVIFEFEIPNSINQFINTIFSAFAN